MVSTQKNKNLNIRISEEDLNIIREKSADTGQSITELITNYIKSIQYAKMDISHDGDCIKVYVPSGIGDCVWSMTKIQSMREKLNADFVEVVIQDTNFRRSHEFIQHFDFVDSVSYDNFEIHDSPPYIPHPVPGIDINNVIEGVLTDKLGRYNYKNSGLMPGQKNSYLMIANGHLERGNKLEDWMPEFDTNFNIMHENFKFTERELNRADLLSRSFGKPFVVFYLGPTEGNTVAGFNRDSIFSLEDWAELYGLIKEKSDVKLVVVGAAKDSLYSADLRYKLERSARKDLVDMCGQTTTGEAFALIKRSKFLVSYTAGIGIVSTYMHHPTVMFWRPDGNSICENYYLSFSNLFSVNSMPPEARGDSIFYYPAFYGEDNPRDIMDVITRKQWI